MLDLFFDDTHRALRDAASAFVAREIRPHVAEWERAGWFPESLSRAAGEAGLLGVGYPESLGGGGGDVFHRLIVTEALVRGGSGGVAAGLGSHAISLPLILDHGNDAQRARFVPPVLCGERVACLAVTEPGAGSDVAGITTRATRDGDHFVLHGTKCFITSGVRADLAVVAARTGAEGHGGLSLFIVERGTPGFTASAPMEKMGWRASDTATLYFDQCRVPAENLIGEQDGGFYLLMSNFVPERLMLAAMAVATAKLALEEAERYAVERAAFGRNIGRFQVIRHRLADMATREESARAFVAVVAERARRGEDVVSEVAMAKNHAVDACLWICDQAVQIFGGHGYMAEHLVERLYRDARLLPLGGGTSEIMREIIVRRRGYGG
ncbi:acyl-CoA dehydrogenase family protein [Myxococcota bacterium]|nr:acyl-CoA dehydrogenase family protein [Myxococcota bacterium]